MANDTDLLTSTDSDVPSARRNGEIDRRQASLRSLDMTSGAQDVAPVGSAATSGEKLDSFVANGCVKLLEGTLEDATDPVVCSNNNATPTCFDEEVLKLAQTVGNQHSTANGLVPPAIDKHGNQLTGGTRSLSQHSTEISQNYPPAAADLASAEVPCETLADESAQNCDVDGSHGQLPDEKSSSFECGLQPTELMPDLSGLNIADKDSGYPSVPCDDSVATQSDTKDSTIKYVVYESERQMESIMQLITKDLSEPYSIYTYRYFIHNWPKLCFLVCT